MSTYLRKISITVIFCCLFGILFLLSSKEQEIEIQEKIIIQEVIVEKIIEKPFEIIVDRPVEIIVEKRVEVYQKKEWNDHLIRFYQGPLVSYHNPNCPKYVHVPINKVAGLGHRLINWCVNRMISDMFNITMVVSTIEMNGDHGGYNGADQFFGFNYEEKSFEQVKSIPDITIVNIPDFPQKKDLQEMFIPFKDSIQPYSDKCNVLFVQQEVWPPTLLPIKFIALRKFQESLKRQNLPNLVYQQNTINIAIHIRIGDNRDTPMSYFPNLLSEIISILHPLVPSIFVFSEGRDFQELVSFKNLIYMNSDAITSFYHLTQSDITICSASSFCTIASLLSTKPLFVLAPDRPQDLDYKSCNIGNICVNNKEGKFGQTDVSFLKDFIIKWSVEH